MSLSDVQSALMGAVSARIGYLNVPIAWENAPFVPNDDGGKWAQVFFMPNVPSVASLGGDGQDMVDGIVQIDFSYPPKTGTSESIQDFEFVRAGFPSGSRFSYGQQDVVILTCGRSSGRFVDNWYRVSITIGWYALIHR